MNKKTVLAVVVLVLSLIVSIGLIYSSSAQAAASNVTVFVVIDRGIEASFTPAQVKNRHAVSEFMEKDLPPVCKDAGFTAVILKDKANFVSGAGKYLLKVKVTSYNPGNQAARMMVGFGAGTASMDTYYELLGPKMAVLLADKTHITSSVSWQKIIRKIDMDTAKAVARKLPL
jgi:hypothetical protein